MATLPPVTGAWLPGHAPGRRQFVKLYSERANMLEAGGALSDVQVAYESWGTLNERASNAVLVLHALTGDSHAAGEMGPGHVGDGWWNSLIGAGKVIDTDRFFVVCPNVLGGCQGTTGPASPHPDGTGPYGSRFPRITVRDQTVVEAALATRLGISTWHAVIGGSMGGMRALEWCVSFPDRVRASAILAVGGAATAEQIAWSATQNNIIRADAGFQGGDFYGGPPGSGPHRGMTLARAVGQITYRTEAELDDRFGRGRQGDERPIEGGRFAIESYLDYQGEKLAQRFDANTYIVLSEAMNLHDIGRGRGGIGAALARVSADVVIAGIDSDRLYPLRLQEELAAGIRTADGITVIASPSGHDGFLTETEQVKDVIHSVL
ncbi:MAG: homoserine O-acetyltransferase [Acidimicrobiia bacterium]